MKVIVLAGGRGTRLWPMSRELHSRQFLHLPGCRESVLASAYVRAQALKTRVPTTTWSSSKHF